jgi:hypothetical protein
MFVCLYIPQMIVLIETETPGLGHSDGLTRTTAEAEIR